MELGKLIKWLESQDHDLRVRGGFGMPSSYRRYYEDVAFEPADETTIGQMLEYARSALGATFDGYKGGRYRMDEFTTCWIAPYGQTVDAPITEATLEMMIVSSEIAQLRADIARVTAERDARPEISGEDVAYFLRVVEGAVGLGGDCRDPKTFRRVHKALRAIAAKGVQ